MTAPSAPEREIGYAAEAGSTSYNWWMYDAETTPELRWPLSVQVYDQMRTQDAQIQSVLRAVTMPVRRTPWRIDPAGAREEVVRLVADDLGLPVVGESKPTAPPRMKDRFSWSEHLRLALLMLPFGHMYFEQTYRITDGGTRAHLRKLGPRLPRTIEDIDVARDGGLISITQYGTVSTDGPQRPIPVDRLVAYVHEREGGNWLGRSILRAAYKNWLLKDRLLRVQAQTIERNGMGIPTYTAAETETSLATGKALAMGLRAGETAGAAIPFGATLALLGVTGTLPDADPAIRYHDEQIARAVLAHFLNLGTQTGSWALGTTFADFFTLSLQTLADQVADTATQHVVEDLVDVNWGEDEPAPRIVHDEIGSRQQATAAAIKSLVDAGILEPDEVLEESSRQQYGLPPKDPATTRGQDQAGADAGLGQPFYASAGGADPKGDAGPTGDEDEEPGPYDEDDDEPASGPVPVHAATAWNPALHPRNRQGQFRTVLQRLAHQLQQWAALPGNDPQQPATWRSDPFQGFSRDQLRRAAHARGVALPRNASRDHIAGLLAVDLSQPGTGHRPNPRPGRPAAPAVPTPAAPAAPTRPAWPTTISGQVMNDLQAWVNAGTPHVDPLKHYSQTQLDIAARHLGLPGGQRRGPQLQQHAIATLTVGDPVAEQPIHPNRVGGVTGVTARPMPPNPGSFGQMRQSQEIYLNGTKIGEIDAYGTRTWHATSVAGSSIGLGGNTRMSAIQSLVTHHQAWQARRARAAALNTNVAGVTLSHLNSAGTGIDLDVQFNNNYVGNIHEAPNGQWFAVAPVSASYTLQGGTGPNGTGAGTFYPNKDAAVQALVDAHNLHQLAQAATTGSVPDGGAARTAGLAPTLPNGITIEYWRSPGGTTPSSGSHYSYAASVDVYFGGHLIGVMHDDTAVSGDWIVLKNDGLNRSRRYTASGISTGSMDLRNLYQANPWTTPSRNLHGPRPTVAERVQDAVNRHMAQGGGANDPNDPLSGFSRAQLMTAARKNNMAIPAGMSRRNLSSALVLTLAPPPPPPPARPLSTHAPSVDPAVRAAQDVLYGVDPKAKTATRQLQVYGAMRKPQFDTLAVHEQQAVLADLSFIATTAKGPNKTKADRVLNQFTPAGTPMGQAPTPSAQIVGPATGTQTRLPSPRTGLLKQATSSGARGDTWMSGTAGPQVWGEYGSGGILLRHVDGQGVERFLMTQRGPGVSDPGKWSYPGGAFESLEDFYQGSTREVAEELGFTDTHFAGSTVHGYHVFERPDVQAKDGATGRTKPWTYHSIAADVPGMITPNLSTSGARAETSDAKWMTRAEIDRLDQRGELHAPVAGGKLQRNVMSLFPAKPAVSRPGPITKRPARLTGTPSVPGRGSAPHKPSRGVDLISDQASKDKLRQDVKNTRAAYAGKSADERLAAIGAMQGFDEVPTVATKAEVDRLLATGDYIEAWRGVRGRGAGGGRRSGRGGTVTSSKTAAQVNEDMRSGVAWYGSGMFGNGYYFATDKSIARGYGDGTSGSLARVLIPKTVKKEKHTVIERRAHAASSPTSQARGRRHEEGTLYDEGRYAAAVGLDVIEIPYNANTRHIATPTKPAYLVVNRSVLIVEEA